MIFVKALNPGMMQAVSAAFLGEKPVKNPLVG